MRRTLPGRVLSMLAQHTYWRGPHPCHGFVLIPILKLESSPPVYGEKSSSNLGMVFDSIVQSPATIMLNANTLIFNIMGHLFIS